MPNALPLSDSQLIFLFCSQITATNFHQIFAYIQSLLKMFQYIENNKLLTKHYFLKIRLIYFVVVVGADVTAAEASLN